MGCGFARNVLMSIEIKKGIIKEKGMNHQLIEQLKGDISGDVKMYCKFQYKSKPRWLVRCGNPKNMQFGKECISSRCPHKAPRKQKIWW